MTILFINYKTNMIMEIKNVPFNSTDAVDKYNFDINKRFYIGFENEPEKPYSVMFENLDWIKKNFGEQAERLNEGRKETIKNLQNCIKYRVPMWELDMIQWYDESSGKFLKPREKNFKFDKEEKVQVYPHKLSDHAVERFQKDIDRGLLIVCQWV
jgi:uncharacterized protein YdhG (YjbR/CyaY superfamily)